MIRTTGLLALGVALGAAATLLLVNRSGGALQGLVADGEPGSIADAETFRAGPDNSLSVSERFIETYRDGDADAVDVGAALQALATIEPPRARRNASLALLAIVGDNAAGARRIADALPAAERPAFLAARLGQLAASDPSGALREMLGMSNGTHRLMATEHIAAAWAAQDPEAALAEAYLLPDDLATQFRRNVLTEWARLDGEAVLNYLVSANLDALEVVGALSFLSAYPDGLLAVADRRGDVLGTTIKVSALGVLAESDPQAAVAHVEAMPEGTERDQTVMMVAIFYALEDADGATRWVERMLPASPNARMLVASGLAQRDPVRALDMLSQGPPAPETQMMLGAIVQQAAQQSDQARSVAQELSARDDAQGRSLLASLLSSWVLQDGDAALTWAVEREPAVDPGLLGNAAASLANSDPAMAADYAERIPAQYRDVWITRMAGPYGRNNLDSAVSWIARFRGQPVYDEAFTQLVTQAAQSNPTGAAQLLVSASADAQREAASAVATQWARQDPQAAAQWAMTLSDPAASEQALARVAQILALQSPEEAMQLLQSRVADPQARARIEEMAGLTQSP